jgi:lipoprotein-anchoring transpeptidase ErfK/SrfK
VGKLIKASLVALAVFMSVAPSQAKQLNISPDSFAILGGMDGDQYASASMPQQWKNTYAQDDVSGPNRETVAFQTDLKPGSILVRTAERKLYFILLGGQAIAYRVGVGKEGFAWSGTNHISRKATWPDWRPPDVMIKREAERGHIIPAFMKGGPSNPLGARAMYIGSTDFRIHGTTQPWSIGHAVSSGCIRMLNEHVIDLYSRVKVGAKVVVE